VTTASATPPGNPDNGRASYLLLSGREVTSNRSESRFWLV